MKSSFRGSKITSLLALFGAVAFGILNPGYVATHASESTNGNVDDSVITAKVKSGFLADDAAKSFTTSVETVQSVVQFNGFADVSPHKSAAGKDHRSSEGHHE